MRIVPLDQTPLPSIAPDLVFDGVLADFAPALAGEVANRGGLRARAALATAVLICLGTDARVRADELRDGDINRGWPGDSFDLDESAGEAPIGSRLWLLRRRTIDDIEVPRLAEGYAVEALAPLIRQGAAAKATATAVADPARNALELYVELTDRDGAVIVANRYKVLWNDNAHGT